MGVRAAPGARPAIADRDSRDAPRARAQPGRAGVATPRRPSGPFDKPRVVTIERVRNGHLYVRNPKHVARSLRSQLRGILISFRVRTGAGPRTEGVVRQRYFPDARGVDGHPHPDLHKARLAGESCSPASPGRHSPANPKHVSSCPVPKCGHSGPELSLTRAPITTARGPNGPFKGGTAGAARRGPGSGRRRRFR